MYRAAKAVSLALLLLLASVGFGPAPATSVVDLAPPTAGLAVAIEEPAPIPTGLPTHAPPRAPEAEPTPTRTAPPGRQSPASPQRYETERTPTPTPAASPRVVALTIDDGWSRSAFDSILDMLAENDARATFFLVATAAERLGRERMARLVEEGHEIGYHSYDHGPLEILQRWGEEEWTADHARWTEAMHALLGAELYAQGVTPYARAPYRLATVGFAKMAEGRLQLFDWDTDVHAIRRIPANDGDVILAHVRHSDLEALEALLLDPQYRVVNLSELDRDETPLPAK